MTDTVRILDEASFDEALLSTEGLVIVEFYTDTCLHCKAMEPIFADLSQEMGRFALFAKVNAGSTLSIARKYGIMGTPTFKFFCGARPIGELVGEINTTILRNTIKDFVRHRNDCATKVTPIIYEMDGYG
jgi:thioredoxin 1